MPSLNGPYDHKVCRKLLEPTATGKFDKKNGEGRSLALNAVQGAAAAVLYQVELVAGWAETWRFAQFLKS